MNTEKSEQKIQKSGNRKTVLGVRISPEQKEKFSQIALKLGITMSELAENILLNNDNLLIDKDRLVKENSDFKRQLDELTKQLNNSNANHKTEADSLKKCLAELQSYVSTVKGQVAIHQDKRLLHFLSMVKGRKDTIVTPDNGTFSITYETTTDVLTSLIYSNKLKP